ncbi:hypothetical protein, partial [Serratia marcescens]|uniref:hypothetical protein n=1 Tax=Serratia marcescens TaxID=615 RepID=UPI002813D621
MEFDESSEAIQNTEVNKLINQTEKLSILDEDEEDETEINYISQGDRQTGTSCVAPLNTLNIQAETGTSQHTGSETSGPVGQTKDALGPNFKWTTNHLRDQVIG